MMVSVDTMQVSTKADHGSRTFRNYLYTQSKLSMLQQGIDSRRVSSHAPQMGVSN
jgi:hypothetical protein